MNEAQQARVLEILNDAEKWVDDNEIFEFEEDPPGDIMYDGFVLILDMVKTKKGMK